MIMDEPDVFLDFENLNSLKNLITWLADKVWGRYKTILYISLLYCVGHGVLATADLFHTIEARRYWYFEYIGHLLYGKECLPYYN